MLKTAMVMAAGHGTRMRPLTHDRAKAMVTVGGKPLIDHMLIRLAQAGVKRAIVNVHAHADHLEAHVTAQDYGLEIIISDEREELLETGGGVVNALPLLGSEPILICNIDAIWIAFEDVLQTLFKAWDGDEMDELLLLARRDMALGHDGAGDFEFETLTGTPDNRSVKSSGPIRRRVGETAPYYYSGVQIFKPSLAKPFPIKNFSRNKIWDVSLSRRGLFGTVMPAFWMHVGDPKAKLAAEAVLKQAGTE